MKKEKYEISPELDAAILQYASEKKFRRNHWYLSMPARAAAVVLVGAVLACLQFYNRSSEKNTSAVIMAENIQNSDAEWNDFEEKMEFIAEEIFVEAKYLAQL